MNTEKLHVPYLIVSSMFKNEHEIQKRILTPLGSMDLCMKKKYISGTGIQDITEIHIDAEIPLPSLAESFKSCFYDEFAEFSFEIAKKTMLAEPVRDFSMVLRLTSSFGVQRLVRKAGSNQRFCSE
jgi:hypothetical protein